MQRAFFYQKYARRYLSSTVSFSDNMHRDQMFVPYGFKAAVLIFECVSSIFCVIIKSGCRGKWPYTTSHLVLLLPFIKHCK